MKISANNETVERMAADGRHLAHPARWATAIAHFLR